MKKRVALIQMEIAFSNVEKNEKTLKHLFEKAMAFSPDFVCLPEMWTTGFFPSKKLRVLADHEGQRIKAFLKPLASSFGVNIVGGSVVNEKQGKLYNTSFVFDRKGNVVAEYDKIHRFSAGKEDDYFDAGNKLSLFYLDDIPVGMALCYDLRFPELIRSLALNGAQILFLPAAWPHPRSDHWLTLLKARSIENQIFVVGVNGLGKMEKTTLCGGSVVFNPWGESLVKISEREEILIADMETSLISKVRNQIRVFEDRRPSLYFKE